MMRIGYPLSESVAPPGTAWDAEGLRGNEANENNLMVLAPAWARKGQSGCRFAQEDVALRLPASGARASAPMPEAARYCTLRMIVNVLVLVSGTAPPLVEAMVTV